MQVFATTAADNLRLKTAASPSELGEHERLPFRHGGIAVSSQRPARIGVILVEDEEQDAARSGERAADDHGAKRSCTRPAWEQPLHRFGPCGPHGLVAVSMKERRRRPRMPSRSA